ncbi:MAG: tRNA pseudouridine(38-40) synthase TruA [Promethearchaeota archaeon]
MENHRYLFKFYYIGTKNFHGSQRQLSLLTIEDCLLKALKKRNYINDISTSGFEVASRTDRLVSARGAAFSFIVKKKLFLMEINSTLPNQIGMWAWAEVPIAFLSRYNAILRHYKYIVPNSLSDLQRNFNIDFKIMQNACKELEGTHDFVNFSKREKNEKKTIRDIKSANITIKDDYIVFDFKSRAFLRQQVRRMVKKILELGMGEIKREEFTELFNPKKKISFQPAEPQGLILWDIKYNEKIKFIIDLKSKKRMDKYFKEQEIKFGLKHRLFRTLQQDNFG